jgi:hypothetical protein
VQAPLQPRGCIYAQNLPHLKGQSSGTCTLVINLVVYLEFYLLYVLIVAVEGVLEFTEIYKEKAFF